MQIPNVAIAGLLALAACAPSPLRPSVGRTETYSSAGGSSHGRAAYTPRSIELHVSRRAGAPCGEETPSIEFAFDSSDITLEQDLEIHRLAQCLSEPPHDRATVTLVGRTDPSASEAYNLALGLERAARVKDKLVAHGLASDRVVVTSMGETGQHPEGRQVDIRITNAAPIGTE